MGEQTQGRWCKTCQHLWEPSPHVFRCGYRAPAPWPINEFAPNLVIAKRHVVPGDDYFSVLGNTSDWTEVMDCPTWEAKETGASGEGE